MTSLLFATALVGSAAPGCAPSSLRGQSIADPLDTPDAIAAIACAGDLAYAVTRSQKLRAWNLRTRARHPLARGGALGIARDGAVALTASGTVVDAWDPQSGAPIATRRFEHGIAAVRAVSRAAAYVVAKRPSVHYPPFAAAVPPPDTELVSWELASGTIEAIGARNGCDNLWLSADGARSLCDGAWRDRPSRVDTYLPPLAPEWAPPAPAAEPAPCPRCAPDDPETGYSLLSTWLSADGLTVYLTYRRDEGGREWRLDRWLPDPAGKTAGRLDRLAVSHESIIDRVVAVSRDGRTILTDPGRRPPVLRHAPGYEGVPLLAPPVTAAAFSDDERLVVTGHGDGRLRVWDAESARFVGGE